MTNVDRPRRKRKEMQVWTLEEAIRFLEEAKKTKPHSLLSLRVCEEEKS